MSDVVLVPAAELETRAANALRQAGADERSVAAATRAMMHASRLGVDSHGVRLTEHYCRVLRGGRVNGRPVVAVTRTAAGSAVLDAGDGLGHAPAYEAMALAVELAREAGIGAVGVRRSSHYGAAGAYALAGAEAGCIALSTTNTDAIVALHGGAARFHGTNPLALAAPVPGARPWLLDMATSSIPFNRVLLYRSLDQTLPPGVAADRAGVATTDPHEGHMLIPLGGADYGYKGAGLAGIAVLLSAVLTGTTLDPDFIPMVGTDNYSTPRNMGHFCLAIDPGRFAAKGVYEAAITAYLAALRAAPARPGEAVMAPGDREWTVEAGRRRDGIPVDPDTAKFLGIALK